MSESSSEPARSTGAQAADRPSEAEELQRWRRALAVLAEPVPRDERIRRRLRHLRRWLAQTEATRG